MRPSSKKPRVLVSSNLKLFGSFFTPEHQARLSGWADWHRLASRTVTSEMRKELKEADALITTWDSPVFSEELLGWAPRLRIISHCGGAVKGRFPRLLFDRLVIANAASPMARHVAELAVTFLLYFARDVDRYRELLRRPSNAIYEEMHLSGGGDQTILEREVGLIGFGRIGRAIADLLVPFGTRLRVYDPYVAPESVACGTVQLDSLEAVLAESQYLIVAAGLTDETRLMLNRKRLAILPRGAVVINVARGGLVDLDALTRMVLKGRLRCALDVTDPLEPLPGRHPLRRASRAILTPHVGAISRAVRHAITDIILADLARFFAGEPVENRVTAEMLDRMT
jgi:phosphoglycerate dehydrogenase-like enzyme